MKEKQLKQLLRGYWAGLDSFDLEEEEEANLIFLYRQELEENKHLLSSDEIKKLKELDLKALKLYEKYKNKNTEAVDWLKDTISIINVDIPFRV